MKILLEPDFFIQTERQTDGWMARHTDRHDKADSRFLQLCHHTK